MSLKDPAVAEPFFLRVSALLTAALVYELWWVGCGQDGEFSGGDLRVFGIVSAGLAAFLLLMRSLFAKKELKAEAPTKAPRVPSARDNAVPLAVASLITGVGCYWLWSNSVEESGSVPNRADDVLGLVLLGIWAAFTLPMIGMLVVALRRERKAAAKNQKQEQTGEPAIASPRPRSPEEAPDLPAMGPFSIVLTVVFFSLLALTRERRMSGGMSGATFLAGVLCLGAILSFLAGLKAHQVQSRARRASRRVKPLDPQS